MAMEAYIYLGLVDKTVESFTQCVVGGLDPTVVVGVFLLLIHPPGL